MEVGESLTIYLSSDPDRRLVRVGLIGEEVIWSSPVAIPRPRVRKVLPLASEKLSPEEAIAFIRELGGRVHTAEGASEKSVDVSLVDNATADSWRVWGSIDTARQRCWE
jgi:hypothetical protein